MIAVTFALSSESAAFVKLLANCRRTPRGAIEFVTGECAGRSISVVHTGVGEKSTRARLSGFLEQEKPELLISSGFAGALHDAWQPGDLLLARNVSSEGLYAAAEKALPQAKRGNITTAHMIVDSAAARTELAQRHRADAVDMESEIIAEMCANRDIPMLSLRAISDTPASPFPIPPDVLFDIQRQRTDAVRLFFYIATHPGVIANFATFARQIRAARAALADALCLLIRGGSLL